MSAKYTPQKIDNSLVLFALRYEHCNKCSRAMVIASKGNTPFPRWLGNSFPAQAKRAGLSIRSSTKVDDEYICCDCEKAGFADFECYLCKKRKATNKIQAQFGDPPEYLCLDCYETVSAKIWDQAESKLYNSHRYDFC